MDLQIKLVVVVVVVVVVVLNFRSKGQWYVVGDTQRAISSKCLFLFPQYVPGPLNSFFIKFKSKFLTKVVFGLPSK